MSETARLENLYVLVSGLENIPVDIIRGIFSFLLELDTVIGFEVSLDSNPVVNWTGKYTNGTLNNTQTQLSLYGEFNTILHITAPLPMIIFSIRYRSYLACSRDKWSLLDKDSIRSRISLRRADDYLSTN